MNEFKGHVGIGPAVEGIALAAHDNFSTRYDLDRDRGIVSRPSHKLYGENYVGRIYVLNAAKGGALPRPGCFARWCARRWRRSPWC